MKRNLAILSKLERCIFLANPFLGIYSIDIPVHMQVYTNDIHCNVVGNRKVFEEKSRWQRLKRLSSLVSRNSAR